MSASLVAKGLAGGHGHRTLFDDLDLTVDTTVEILPLEAGSSKTVTLRIVTSNGDGKNGCNLTGSTTATFAVGSSDPAVATVSPSSVTFDSCEATRDLTVTGAVRSTATTLEEVVAEIAATRVTERGETRADDRATEAAMEDRKREGYF